MTDTLSQLVQQGVTVYCPEMIDIGEEVDPARIGRQVILHPGTRLRGAQTLIGDGCIIGEEAPATLDDCSLGANVQFRGGYASKSVFLDNVIVGSEARIRPGCLLEEHSSVAHCVGLKQTILMPYAEIGSLVNFCDALLAGGTGRHDHTEVGSSFVHFNFTPTSSKATASLFGDVPRGVFLRQPRIFLGGQSGAVGPLRVGFGTVLGAGSLLRDDVPDGQFVITESSQAINRPVATPGKISARRLAIVVHHNVNYIAQLRALRLWYTNVRAALVGQTELIKAAVVVLDGAIEERVGRLRRFATAIDPQQESHRQVPERIESLIEVALATELTVDQAVVDAMVAQEQPYLESLKALDEETVAAGSAWLQGCVDSIITVALATIPALDCSAV